MFLPFSSLCPNSRHMTPQAPHLGHRKPLHGSAPTCFAQSNSVSSVTAYFSHIMAGRRPYLVETVHTSRKYSQTVLYSSVTLAEVKPSLSHMLNPPTLHASFCTCMLPNTTARSLLTEKHPLCINGSKMNKAI